MVANSESTGKKDVALEEPIQEETPFVDANSNGQRGSAVFSYDNSNGNIKRFPIVGVGASAGGLGAFEDFFSAMPKDSDMGMAFVLVQHLSPDHKSMLSEIIKRYTRMEVYDVKDGMPAEINCVYIIPPNRDMVIMDGVLHLLEPAEPRGYRMPIDSFFRSLATDQEERAIGIVLSGTGSDGTQGLRVIKGEGGMVMAQSPEHSEYTGMPVSAIETGLVDYVLPPQEMPSQLIKYISDIKGSINSSLSNESSMEKIFHQLISYTGHDFSQYKRKTVDRRISRRMAVHHIKRIEGYANYLKQKPEEVEALFRDLLISVTNFFRNPNTFVVLKEQVIPHIFENKSPEEVIRIWVVGCSTGEEAYSVGILLKEYMENLKQSFKIQIFATDIDERNIKFARRGMYPASISADVSQERLKRFFTYNSKDDTYRINKDIRDIIIFSEQDVIKDPPFSKIDMITCRNLLIYMNKDIQKHLIHMFHYSLNTGGYLLLGSSESIREYSNLFETVDRHSKIYVSKFISSEYRSWVGKFLSPDMRGDVHKSSAHKPPVDAKIKLRELTERKLLQQYAPSGALVDEHGDILYLHGRTSMYLEMPVGEPGYNIMEMAREGLQSALVTSLRKAVVRKETVFRPDLNVKTNGEYTTIDLIVRPVEEAAEQKLFLITFDAHPGETKDQKEISASKNESKNIIDISDESEESIQALKEELRTKEEYLRASNEELEIANEELKSSNEEMQSMNEELQSTNEELETSREELHSLNEELSTVNTELQTKVAELSQANDDINNILDGTGMGIVFVDTDLHIQRFTPAATKMINLIPTDVGRPIEHTVSNLSGYNNLVSDIGNVLDTLEPMDTEVRTNDNEWFILNIKPYRTVEDIVKGAVITFIDITKLKILRDKQIEIISRLASVIYDSGDAIILTDMQGKILAWNPMAEKMYGWSKAEALTMNINDIIPDDDQKEALSMLQKLCHADILESSKVQRVTKDGKILDVLLTATPLLDKEGKVYSVVTIERESTS
jgi:two-component system CheB/CheR fusion protein